MADQTRRVSPTMTYSRHALNRLMRMQRFGQASPLLTAISYAVVLVAVLIAVLPFFYIVSTAIKQSKFLFEYPPQWIPRELYWGNFVTLFTKNPGLRWTFNTLFVSLVVTGLKLFFDSMAGYAFAKMQFPGK